MEQLPFSEKIESKVRFRKFDRNVQENELKWHFDEQDRMITPTHTTDWKFQMDDELPIDLIEGNEIFIPQGVYHRIIKGSGDLELKVKFVD